MAIPSFHSLALLLAGHPHKVHNLSASFLLPANDILLPVRATVETVDGKPLSRVTTSSSVSLSIEDLGAAKVENVGLTIDCEDWGITNLLKIPISFEE